jgi:hypothetical protein
MNICKKKIEEELILSISNNKILFSVSLKNAPDHMVHFSKFYEIDYSTHFCQIL